MEWQPIETAPAHIEGCSKILVAFWRGDAASQVEIEMRLPDGDWWRMERAKGHLKHLLGWMPLPSPPQENSETK